MKISFKTNKPVGKYRAFSNQTHDIKVSGVCVGQIDNEDYTIRLMVLKNHIYTDNNQNCPWVWLKLKAKPISLDNAKQFVKEELKSILEKNNIQLNGI